MFATLWRGSSSRATTTPSSRTSIRSSAQSPLTDRKKSASRVTERNNKRSLVYTLLGVLNKKHRLHMKRARKWKRIDDVWSGCLVVLNAACFSALVLNYQQDNEGVQMLAAIFSSVSMVGGALKQSMAVSLKWSKSQSLALQCSDLAREVAIVVGNPNLNADELTQVLHDMDHRLALIQGSEPLLQVSPSQSVSSHKESLPRDVPVPSDTTDQAVVRPDSLRLSTVPFSAADGKVAMATVLPRVPGSESARTV